MRRDAAHARSRWIASPNHTPMSFVHSDGSCAVLMLAVIAAIGAGWCRSHRGLRFALKRYRPMRKRNATEQGVFMKRHLMLGTVFSAALAIGLSAQTPSPSPTSQSPTSQTPTSQSPTSQDRSSSAQTITVTGCLKADTSSPSSTPGAAGAPASSASAGYILEASGSGSASAANPTEKPSPTATSGMSSNTTYKLTGSSSDLATMVGKKVEVKGMVQKSASSGAAGAESRPGASSDSSKHQQLRVTSVKEVSGSCSQ